MQNCPLRAVVFPTRLYDHDELWLSENQSQSESDWLEAQAT
jgi:hypothetical protein